MLNDPDFCIQRVLCSNGFVFFYDWLFYDDRFNIEIYIFCLFWFCSSFKIRTDDSTDKKEE